VLAVSIYPLFLWFFEAVIDVVSTCELNANPHIVIKITIILNVMHNIYNLYGTEVVIYILLVLFKRADDIIPLLYIR
jgi:hypothetical protein